MITLARAYDQKMMRETKLNLIFIAVLMAVTLPGAVILAKKKMEPGARRMGDPDPVRRTIPYMDPLDTPLERIAPPLTRQWVKDLGRVVEGRPQLSHGRQYEALAAAMHEGHGEVLLLAWQHDAAATYNATAAGRPARVELLRQVNLPGEVREELRRAGYIRPPAAVAVLRVITATPAGSTDGKLDLILEQIRADGVLRDFVTVFTSRAASGK